MYNRYTPRQDGGFNRNRMAESNPPPPRPKQQDALGRQPPPNHGHGSHGEIGSASGFLSALLPKQMDTGDLLMLLILLLLLSDGSEDAPDPLLTIALFFLME